MRPAACPNRLICLGPWRYLSGYVTQRLPFSKRSSKQGECAMTSASSTARTAYPGNDFARVSKRFSDVTASFNSRRAAASRLPLGTPRPSESFALRRHGLRPATRLRSEFPTFVSLDHIPPVRLPVQGQPITARAPFLEVRASSPHLLLAGGSLHSPSLD